MTVDEGLIAAALAMTGGGWLMAMVFGPLRAVFADGWRCASRHRAMFWVPVLFGVAYAAFRIAREFHARTRLVESGQSAWPAAVWEWSAFDWHGAVGGAIEETAARVAGPFHVSVAVGPLAAILALLLLLNWKGACRALWQTVSRRHPRFGRPITALMLVAGVPAAVARLGLFFALDYFATKEDARRELFVAGLVDAGGWFFEHFAGVFIQIALLVIASGWVRGIRIVPGDFVEFTMRRFVAVLPAAGLVALLAFAILQVPVLATGYHPAALAAVLPWLPGAAVALHILTMVFATVQIQMALENRGLRGAFKENMRFLRSHGRHLLWFLMITALPAFLVSSVFDALQVSVGEWTWPEIGLRLVEPFVWGILAGWWLASWVCLFRACEVDRLEKRIEY